VDTKKTPKKRKRVYRVEFNIIEKPTELGDYGGDKQMIIYLRCFAKTLEDHWLSIKNLKIRRMKNA